MELSSKAKKEPMHRTSKPDSKLIAIPYFHLDLAPDHVNLFGEHYWEMRSPWREGKPPLNTGVAPRVPIRASLADILEQNADTKYYLTKTACLGILRRSEERGKKLPKQLNAALMIQAGLTDNTHISPELKSYHINQRDEIIDSNGVSGALMATQNMQKQAFITQASPSSPISFDGYNGDLTGEISSTLGTNCGMSSGRNGVIQPLPVGIDSRYTGPLDIAPTMSARYGTGGNNVPLVEQAPHTFCIVGNIIDRQPENGGNGMGCQEDVSYTP